MVGAFADSKRLPFFYAAFDEEPWLLEEVVVGVRMEQRHEGINSDEVGLVRVIAHTPRTDITIIDNPRHIGGEYGYLPDKRFPDITLRVDGQFGVEYILDSGCVYVMFRSLYEPLMPVAMYDLEGNGGVKTRYEWVGDGEVEGQWYMIKADNLYSDDGGRRSWWN